MNDTVMSWKTNQPHLVESTMVLQATYLNHHNPVLRGRIQTRKVIPINPSIAHYVIQMITKHPNVQSTWEPQIEKID